MEYNPFSLNNKKILITGASSGIGRVSAIECARMGAEVILSGRNQVRLEETRDSIPEGHARLIAGDLTKSETIESLVSNIAQLDGVVFCAGVGKTLPMQFCTRDKYNELFEINFYSQVELFRLLIKRKRLLKGSSVVFVSSIAGVYTYELGNAIYGATKAAIDASMKYFARELAPKGIRVNSVNPGVTETPFIHGGPISEEQLKIYTTKYPLGRLGTPQDIAYGIIYLLSDASSWVTGHPLVISGGRLLM